MDLTKKWQKLWSTSKERTKSLEAALQQAEELHKSIHMLLEWLSDAEMKLRFSGPLSEDEEEIMQYIRQHEQFMTELNEKQKDKDSTLQLANDILLKCHPDATNIIKQWITIIESRWDEVASWALQRHDKLDEHLKNIRDLQDHLDDLMQWITGREKVLIELGMQPLPDDQNLLRTLLQEHQEFMDGLSARQSEIDVVCKPMRPGSVSSSRKKSSKMNRITG